MEKARIEQMQKYDLHCHLDGSLSEKCIRMLAEQADVTLPQGELREYLTADPACENLAQYLTKFDLPLACLTTKTAFKEAVKDVIKTGEAENTVYMEIRFAPLLSVSETLSVRDIIEGALEGIKEGCQSSPGKAELILCGMRHMPVEENIRLAKIAADYYGHGVCALDLAGDEAAYPVRQQAEFFRTARELGIPFTIHAGECGSAGSIWDALELGASRIGHGIAAAKDERLMKYCAERSIPFELCPTSNLQTKAVKSMKEYPLRRFLETGIPVTINTDNRTVSNTSLTEEFALAAAALDLSKEELEQICDNGRKAAFGEMQRTQGQS